MDIKKDIKRNEVISAKPIGRPKKYANDAERKAARALAARARRAKLKAEGYKEIRILKKPRTKQQSRE